MSGSGSGVPIVAVCPSPETMATRGVVAGPRWTVICAWPTLPPTSVAVTRIGLSPATSGSDGTRNERFDTCAGTPLTATDTCPALTVPGTMSLTRPETRTASS